MQNITVVKVSGHEIDDAVFLSRFAETIAAIDVPLIIVHGGGREITDMQKRMGITPSYIDGLRVTDEESLTLVEMVLCGLINTRLVRLLVSAGVDAMGLSGVDRGIIRARKMQYQEHDMGYTGSVDVVRGDALIALLAERIIPVIAPVCLGDESTYNVNADHVAGAVAGAVAAERVVFLTNVPGVLKGGRLLDRLTAEETDRLIADGTIFGGMIPKVRTATAALANGARSAVITDLDGLRMGKGTVFMPAGG
jgi:acetylglutamate kinase